MSLTDSEIQLLWKDKEFNGSFQSARAFQHAIHFEKNIHIPLNRIYKVLSKLPEFLMLMKPMRHFDRRSYSDVHGFFKLVQIDIALMFPYKEYKNFLLIVDVFSHKIFTKSLKSKTAHETTQAIKDIFDEVGMTPECVQSDKGLEFTSPTTQKYMKNNNIYFRGKSGDKKASMAEWGIFKVKKLLYTEMYSRHTKNWPKILPTVVNKINNTESPSLNFLKPAEISSPADDYKVDRKKKFNPPPWQSFQENINKYSKKGDLSIGDTVLLDNKKMSFTKSYKPQVSFNNI